MHRALRPEAPQERIVEPRLLGQVHGDRGARRFQGVRGHRVGAFQGASLNGGRGGNLPAVAAAHRKNERLAGLDLARAVQLRVHDVRDQRHGILHQDGKRRPRIGAAAEGEDRFLLSGASVHRLSLPIEGSVRGEAPRPFAAGCSWPSAPSPPLSASAAFQDRLLRTRGRLQRAGGPRSTSRRSLPARRRRAGGRGAALLDQMLQLLRDGQFIAHAGFLGVYFGSS